MFLEPWKSLASSFALGIKGLCEMADSSPDSIFCLLSPSFSIFPPPFPFITFLFPASQLLLSCAPVFQQVVSLGYLQSMGILPMAVTLKKMVSPPHQQLASDNPRDLFLSFLFLSLPSFRSFLFVSHNPFCSLHLSVL